MSEGEQQTQQTSKYNEAVAQLYRLDHLWQSAHKYSLSGNYLLWNSTLDKIWSELARDLKDKKKYTKHATKYKFFLEQLSACGQLAQNEIRGFNVRHNDFRATQNIILIHKEIWLGFLQNELGKGTKLDDSDDDDFD